MSIEQFGNVSEKLARNPLGIIALAFVLVYAIAGMLTIQGNFQSEERIILVWFLVVFPCVVLAVFFRLVSKHHDKLYAPSDFNDEGHFVRILESKIEQSPKLNHLEELTQKIQEEIDNQPLYRYTKLNEAGKVLTLILFLKKPIDLQTYSESRNFEISDVKSQAELLCRYGWAALEGNSLSITEKGVLEISTFEDICYGRMR